MPAPLKTVRTTKAIRTIITSTPRYRARPAATPATMRSWIGRRRTGRCGSVPNGGPAWSRDSVVRASGFTVFMFMTPAWLDGPGQHIGKIPGVLLIPVPGDQGRSAGVHQGYQK